MTSDKTDRDSSIRQLSEEPNHPCSPSWRIIIELNSHGHRMAYVAHLLRASTSAGTVLITSQEAINTEEFGLHLKSIYPTIIIMNTRRRAVYEALRLGAGNRQAKVVIPDGDHYLTTILTMPRIWLSTNKPAIRLLLMRTERRGSGISETVRVRLKQFTAFLVARLPNVEVFFLTDAFGVVKKRALFPGVRAVPDPVILQRRSGSSLRLKKSGEPFRVGVVGWISPRKNVDILLEAVGRMSAVQVVLAGRIESRLKARLEQMPAWNELLASGRLEVTDRILSDTEFDAAIESLDLVSILHGNDSPSGVLAEAAARGIPSIVPPGGWLEDVAFATGASVVVELSPEGVVAGIDKVVEFKPDYVQKVLAAQQNLEASQFVELLLG